MSRIAILVGLSACSGPWPDIDEADLVPEPASLGSSIGSGSVFRETYINGQYRSDGVYFSVHEKAGYDENGSMHAEENRMIRVDESGRATALAKTPIAGDLIFGTAMFDGVIVAAAEGIAVFSGGAWKVIPFPTGVTLMTFGQVAASTPDHIVMTATAGVYRWSGSAWSDVTIAGGPTAGSLRIASLDASGFRIVSSQGNTVVTNVYDWTTGAATSTDTVLDNASVQSCTPNGTLNDFQMIAVVGGQPTTTWFDAAGFHPGSATTLDRLLPALGSAQVVGISAAFDGHSIPDGSFVTGGVVGEQALMPSGANVTCSCDRTMDPSCDCVPHDVVVLPAIDPTATKLALLSLSSLNARRTFYVRFAPLPFVTAWP